MSKYLRERINIYSGEPITITLRFHYSIYSNVISAFGQDIWVGKSDGEWLTCKIKAVDNDGFYGWVMAFGGNMEVISPKKTREMVKSKLSSAIELYK